jgi:hypothetical protein
VQDFSLKNKSEYFKYHTFHKDIRINTAQSISASSFDGNIIIDEVKEKAYLRTTKGNIEIKSFSGEIDAKTISGGVKITVVCEKNKYKFYGQITAIKGNVTLILPQYNTSSIDVQMASNNDENIYKLSSNLKFNDSLLIKNVWNHNGFYKKITKKCFKSFGTDTIHIFVANGNVFIYILNKPDEKENL